MGRNVQKVEVLSGETAAFFEAINNGTDLACVLISTSYLDQCVATMLQKHFVKCSTAEGLLDPQGGAIGVYATRAKLAYCLGLFPKASIKI